MTIEVQGPDGAVIEFPDGTSPAVMQQAMASRYNRQQNNAPAYARMVLDNGQAIRQRQQDQENTAAVQMRSLAAGRYLRNQMMGPAGSLIGPALDTLADPALRADASRRLADDLRQSHQNAEQVGRLIGAFPSTAPRMLSNASRAIAALPQTVPQTARDIAAATPSALASAYNWLGNNGGIVGVTGNVAAELTGAPALQRRERAQEALDLERARLAHGLLSSGSTPEELAGNVNAETGNAALNIGLSAPLAGPVLRGVVGTGDLLARRLAGEAITREGQRLAMVRAGREARQFFQPTTGERAADPYAMQREQALRRAGPRRAQQIMHGFDDVRAEQLQNRLMSVATRGHAPLNPDLPSAGNTFTDALRTERDSMRSAQNALYQTAHDIAKDVPIAPTDELLSTVLATGKQFFDDAGEDGVRIIRQLHDEIASGTATYARVEQARVALNARLGDAMRAGDSVRAIALRRIKDDLDAFAAPRVPPEARQALLEARRYTQELSDRFGERLRPELASGHVGGRDLGGRQINNVIESDLGGTHAMDAIFGAGAAPRAASFAAVRRIAENAREQIVTPGTAPTAAATGQALRSAGRQTLRGGRATQGGRQFLEPSAAQRAQLGLAPGEREAISSPTLQSLREAFIYRLRRPLDARRPGDLIPFGQMAHDLRQALHGPGREMTEQLFNATERRQLQRALSQLEQAAPRRGSYSPSGPWLSQENIERSLGALTGRLVGRVPGMSGVGNAIEEGVVNARAIRDARAAVRPPSIPGVPSRAPFAREAPSNPPGSSAFGIGAALTGLAAAGGSNDAQAQEPDATATAELAEMQQLRADLAMVQNTRPSSGHDAIIRMQEMLAARHFAQRSHDPDGRWARQTQDAVDAFTPFAENRLRELESNAAARRNRPTPNEVMLQTVVPTAAMAAAAAIAHSVPFAARTARQIGLNRMVTFGGREIADEADLARRVSRINDFARQGGAGNNTPYTRGENERGIGIRRGAANFSGLYLPPQTVTQHAGQLLPSLATAGIGGLAALPTYHFLQQAETERDRAQAIVDRGHATEAQQEALRIANNKVAALTTAFRTELGLLAGGVSGGVHSTLHPGGRPNIALAEQERIRADSYIRTHPLPRGGR